MLSQTTIRDWLELHELGLCTGVKTPEKYLFLTTQKSNESLEQFRKEPILVPSTKQILGLHKFIFEDVHPWAGTFRKEMRYVGSMKGCDVERIKIELEILKVQMRELSKQVANNTEKMRAIAFYHARFERLHPFLDGNGRVGRLFMESQLNFWFGTKDRPMFNPKDYFNILRIAQSGQLTPLTNLLLRRESLPEVPLHSIKLPFYIDPHPFVKHQHLSLLEEVARSRRRIK